MDKPRTIDPLAEDAVRAALGGILRVVSPTLFGAAFAMQWIDHPGAGGGSRSILTAALVLSALTIWWWRWPPARAHRAAALTIAILQVALVGQILAIREPALATLQVILAIGVASFVIDLRWMLGLQILGLGLWLAATRSIEPTYQWQIARFVVVVGYLAAAANHFGRKRSFDRIRALRDERRERELEAEDALRASEQRLRDAQRIAHVGSYQWILETDELIWSEENGRLFGWEPGTAVDNRRFIEAVHPEDRDRVVQAVARSLQNGDPVDVEYRILLADGEERVIQGRGETLRNAEGEPICHQGTSHDITERHRAQEALRASEARLSGILTAMDAARAVIVGRDGVIRSVVGMPDRTGRYGVDRAEIERKTIHDFLPGEAGDLVMEAVHKTYETGERGEIEATVEFPKGIFHFDVSLRAQHSASGEVEAVLAIVRDMTSQRAEAQARRQAQKLESLGVLAGGIAHDFNNLLVGILANAETAMTVLGEGSAVRSELDDIFRASCRAAELTQGLLTYAGDSRLSAERVDLYELVEDTARLVRANLPKGVTIELARGAEPAWALADAAQIRQVVMNFITNAAEAMEERVGPVEVRVDTVEVDRAYLDGCYLSEGLAPGAYSRVEVVDVGLGMDQKTLEHVFDPFFTTKFKGRGLGLASTVGIVRAHGGTLRVASEPGRGTRFGVLLPQVAPAAKEPHASKPLTPTGGVSILVVDDEDLVRTATRRTLEVAEHDVLAVSSGAEAVAAMEAHRDRFDVALIDLTMPGMDGEETFEALRAIDPRLPVIFMSGYSSEEIAQRVAGKASATSIKKPFRRAELLEAIASVASPPTRRS